MKKYFKVLLMVLFMCSIMTPNVVVKAEEPEEVSDNGNIIGASISSGDYQYTELEDGTVEIATYVGGAKEVTIPSTLDGKAVTSIGGEAFMWGEILHL